MKKIFLNFLKEENFSELIQNELINFEISDIDKRIFQSLNRTSIPINISKFEKNSILIELVITSTNLYIFKKLFEATLLKDIEVTWPNTKFSKKFRAYFDEKTIDEVNLKMAINKEFTKRLVSNEITNKSKSTNIFIQKNEF